MKNKEIDAIAEVEKSESLAEEGGSKLGGKKRQSKPGSKAFVFAISAVIIMIGGAFSYKALSLTNGEDVVEEIPEKVVQVIPKIQPKPIKPDPIVETAPPPPPPPPVVTLESQATTTAKEPEKTKEEQKKEDLVRARMLRSTLGDNGASSTPVNHNNGELTGNGLSEGSIGNSLSDQLEPMKLAGSKAGILPNRDFLMTEGTMLDCILQTKLVTTQPGMTRCVLSRDVYSDNGRVVLLDRGSVLTGFYQAGITQGQARIFVQWARVRTPNGVSIELASPGTGSLGESGLGGYVDRHFWERFGGSIMISMIGDLGNWASNQARSSGDNSVQFSNTASGVEQAAAEALRNSINIPPTLYKNQGERVSVFLARDLDFSDVYGLQAR